VEKMADGLVKLSEDDLLQVIQMIHDHKDESTYIQNNLDGKSKSCRTIPLFSRKTCLLTDCL